MNKEIEVFGELILLFIKRKEFNLINVLLERIEEEGKYSILPHLKEYLLKRIKELKGIKEAKLILAFDLNKKKIENLVGELLKEKVEINEKEIDKSLILGGKLIGEDFLIDFSLKNLLIKALNG